MSNPSMWNPECAITEADAVLAAQNRALKSLRIVKNGEAYHLLLQLSWRKDELYLATTRSLKDPRKFKNLDRLIEYIEEHYPGIHNLGITLHWEG